MRDPRHARHARAMAVCHRREASDLYERADDLERDSRTADAEAEDAEPTGLGPAVRKLLGSRAPDLRHRALEREVRALFCDDVINVAQRDVALVLVVGWAGTLDDLLSSVDAVLQ